MDILEILNNNVTGSAKKWVEKLQNNYSYIVYPWILRVDNMLGQLPKEQIEVVRKKFAGIKDTDQLIDKLAEVLVAAEYSHQVPRFQDDNSVMPDIFLRDTSEYIEVKNLNLSDHEKKLIARINNRGDSSVVRVKDDKNNHIASFVLINRMGPAGSLVNEDEQNHQKLFRKAQDLLDKAIEQLDGHNGFIYFVYSIDFATLHIQSHNIRSTRFEQDVISYCATKKVRVVTKELSDFVAPIHVSQNDSSKDLQKTL